MGYGHGRSLLARVMRGRMGPLLLLYRIPQYVCGGCRRWIGVYGLKPGSVAPYQTSPRTVNLCVNIQPPLSPGDQALRGIAKSKPHRSNPGRDIEVDTFLWHVKWIERGQ